eukprot:17236_1
MLNVDIEPKILVVLLGIVDYRSNEPRLSCPTPLFGARIDVENHYTLWSGVPCVDIFPNKNDSKWYHKAHWSENDIEEFCNQSIRRLRDKQYEGLIVCLLGHGDHRSLVSSDGDLVDINSDILSRYSTYLCEKMCIVDACCALGPQNSGFLTICSSHYWTKCVEDRLCGGIFTQSLIHIISSLRIPLASSSVASLYSVLCCAFDTNHQLFSIPSILNPSRHIERGLKKLVLDNGKIMVHIDDPELNVTDIIVYSFHISEKSDELTNESEMIGVVLYQYEGRNEWVEWVMDNDVAVQCRSGYIIIVNKSNLDAIDSNNTSNFHRLYQYRFGKPLSDTEANKYLGTEFGISYHSFVFIQNVVGAFYNELRHQIFDKFEMSQMERMAIRHTLQRMIHDKQRNTLVKDMIKDSYKKKRTYNAGAFRKLNVIQMHYDIFATHHLTICKGEQHWDESNCSASPDVLNGEEQSVYFESPEFQNCEYDPFESYGFRRHLRCLFIFSDETFRSKVIDLFDTLKASNRSIRIMDICRIARSQSPHRYIIDRGVTKFKGQREVDYAIYFKKDYDDEEDAKEDEEEENTQSAAVPRLGLEQYRDGLERGVAIMNELKDLTCDNAIKVTQLARRQVIDKGITTHFTDYIQKKNSKLMELQAMFKDVHPTRNETVSIVNGSICIKSIDGEDQFSNFSFDTFEMSRFSDAIDNDGEMIGMVLYLYGNTFKTAGWVLGDIRFKPGYVYMKTRDNIRDIHVVRNTWHDKLFRSLFNEHLDAKVFGVPFKIKSEGFEFDSSAFNFKLSKQHKECDGIGPDYGVDLAVSDVEKRCIVQVINNWRKSVRITHINKMLKHEYTKETLTHPISIGDVFKPALMFCGPFLKAYEIQSLHTYHDVELPVYEGYKEVDERNAMIFKSTDKSSLQSLYVYGLDYPKGVGMQLRKAIEKKYRIMNFIKLEYVCDIAVTFAFTVIQCHDQYINDGSGLALFLKYTGDTPQITKAFVILLGIAEYEDNRIANLGGVKLDMANHKRLWQNKYKYDVYPSEQIPGSEHYILKYKWTVTEFDAFFKEAILAFERRRQTHQYDAIIGCISSHGSSKNTIITSNDTSKDILEFIKINFWVKSMQSIPRLFLIDCCRDGEYEKKVEDGANDCIPMEPSCICGAKLLKIKVKSITYNGGVRCYHCRVLLSTVSVVWHCSEAKSHPNGYDLCVKCLNIADTESVKCICGQPFEKKRISECYESNKKIMCDGCHRKADPDDPLGGWIYHCPKQKESKLHRNGYDLCTRCAKKGNTAAAELSVVLYGNTPLSSVKEGTSGGLFTTAVIKAFDDNDGTIPLWKLTSNMNPLLDQMSNQKQRVYKEGTPRMDKLLLIPNNKGGHDVMLDYKVNDDAKEIDRLNAARTEQSQKLKNAYEKIQTELLGVAMFGEKCNIGVPFYLVQRIHDIGDLRKKPIQVYVKIDSVETEFAKGYQNWITSLRRAVDIVNHDCPGLHLSETESNESKTIKVVSGYTYDSSGKKVRFAATYGDITCLSKTCTMKLGFWNKSQKDGTALHELLHALGVKHEHTRHDRGDYGITMNKQWIIDNQKNLMQYVKDNGSSAFGITTYDPYSIMNYRNCGAFNVDNDTEYWNGKNATIKDKKRITHLSDIDKVGMNILWPPAVDTDYTPTKDSRNKLYYCGRTQRQNNIELHSTLNPCTTPCASRNGSRETSPEASQGPSFHMATVVETEAADCQSSDCGSNTEHSAIEGNKDCDDDMCTYLNGPNCASCRVIKNGDIPKYNRDGDRVWQGATGYFYCGKSKAIAPKDGFCGPDIGSPCDACLKIITPDEQEIVERLNVVRQNKRLKDAYQKVQEELSGVAMFEAERNIGVPFYLVQNSHDINQLSKKPTNVHVVLDLDESDLKKDWQESIRRAILMVNSNCPGLHLSESQGVESKTIKVVSEYKYDSKGRQFNARTCGNVRNASSCTIRLGFWPERGRKGTVLHELLHALGVQHDHKTKRHDREKYEQWIKDHDGINAFVITPYDPDSIMTYSNCGAFTGKSDGNNSTMKGGRQIDHLSATDKVGMNILWPPAINDQYNPTQSPKNKLYYCGRKFRGEVFPQHEDSDGVCAYRNGANCPTCRVLGNSDIPKENEHHDRVWQGYTGWFYCGIQITHTDGFCGPHRGPPCDACIKLIHPDGKPVTVTSTSLWSWNLFGH